MEVNRAIHSFLVLSLGRIMFVRSPVYLIICLSVTAFLKIRSLNFFVFFYTGLEIYLCQFLLFLLASFISKFFY